MNLFGLNRFFDGSQEDRPPKKGPGRYFQALWDNLGGLLGGNVLTFAGFLPLALGVSLGAVYENFWLTLLAGALGGALAGPFWTAMTALGLQCFRGGTREWLKRWRTAWGQGAGGSALLGGIVGLLSGAFLLCGTLLVQMLGEHAPMVPLVWLVLLVDGLVLCVLIVLTVPVRCAGGLKREERWAAMKAILFQAPLRVLGAAVFLLAWCVLLVGLFPVSVPFALLIGFWPPALLTGQLILPPLAAAVDLPGAVWEPPAPAIGRDGLTAGQRGEIWWRRRWPLVVAGVVCMSLALGTANVLLTTREADLQIAIVHAKPLPDGVRDALEEALTAQIGDLNGDGTAKVVVNDYTVVFDGSAADPDLQTAGSALLVTDLAVGDSAIYVVEDPAGFLAAYGEKVDETDLRLWGDIPTLSGLDAGTWSSVEDLYTDLPGQDLLAPLTVLPSREAEDEALALLLGSP